MLMDFVPISLRYLDERNNLKKAILKCKNITLKIKRTKFKKLELVTKFNYKFHFGFES